MYTRCPHCQTTFRIAEAHLKAAKGMVRCGSCQEVFNATKHLSSGSPGEAPTKTAKTSAPPAPVATQTPIAPKKSSSTASTFSFEDFGDPEDHEHIDLSIPVSRESMPDQSPFMESIYEENSPYNNLDTVGEIHVPGELNFGDSFIKFVEDDGEQEAKPETHPEHAPNPYEDIEDKETPATTLDHTGIDELYKSADQQMNEDELLQKNIEELLSSTSDLVNALPSKDNDVPNPNTQDLADFEREIDNFHRPLQSDPGNKDKTTHKPDKNNLNQADATDDDFDHDFHIDDDELSVNEKEIDGPALSKSESRIAEEKSPRIKPTLTTDIEDELPSATFEIPKALRSNFENFEPPIRPIGLTMGMVALLIVLTVGFGFQLVFFRSYELANQFPPLAPMLTSICNSLPCRYSGSIDVSQIELINRDVRSHPTQKNTLLISAAFINNAKFDQPYPTIAVRLADLSGNIVATRHFKPEEYLDKLYSKFLLMESGTPIHITLAVLDPGDDAINFEFSFL